MRIDTRIGIVRDIISPLRDQFEKIKEINKEYEFYYWDMIYADDTEHIVGLVFIILQNYINSSISDLYPDLKKVYTKYSNDKKIKKSQITRIELIITIANYYKHRDLPPELHNNTTRVLDDLNIKYKEYYDEQDLEYFYAIGASSPVFSGLDMLSENWDFLDLINIVSEWRENLWINEENIRNEFKSISN
ncbi:MAG: hypothetical protein BGO29_02220 [Bacteroidales bacterium 36-12]|nr:MAG: hypothetical protein BGO29_02220 [Bacteroidales bacterium 36-12]